MKSFNSFSSRVPIMALSLFAGHVCFGQLPGAGAPAGASATLTKLFGPVTAFTAKSEVQVFDKDQAEKMSMTMNFALLDNKVRVEVDMAQIKGRDVPPAAAAGMKQLNMDHVTSIVRPDKEATYIIFDGVQSYVITPLSKDEAAAMVKEPKLEKSALGKETIDGHPCVKNKVTLTDDKGEKTEATVWNATDLKDFPVQILTKDKGDTVITRYKQIQFAKPDAKKFEVPAGYKQYDNPQAMMEAVAQAAMSKLLGGAVQQ